MILALLLLATVPAGDAYTALRGRQYEAAIALFQKAIADSPANAALRKDLAYTYLKIGANEAARDRFKEAMLLDPSDDQSALEYAFLCNETRHQAEARRVFDRARKRGSATAEQAFHNIDSALEEGIARWSEAVRLDPANFSAHRELATLAETRDQLDLAATHYEAAWRIKPAQRSLILDLGRVWLQLGRAREANALLLAASRGAEPRVAEAALELLPSRYPFVYEFREALALDPRNIGLHRELAYLLLEMKRPEEAEVEFAAVVKDAPDDLLSAAQLGFLRLARNQRAEAMPLLERVLQGGDEELADRVRFMLKLPRAMRQTAEAPRTEVSLEAKAFAEKSFEKGYLRDAAKYYNIAHEKDPLDFAVMLKLGWANNLLKQDSTAASWFGLARRSTDPKIAAQADHAWRSLEGDNQRFRLSAWLYPIYSSRWRDTFAYGQVKAEWRFHGVPIRPYLSTRFIGDTRGTINTWMPQYLSESAVILAAGLSTPAWKGMTAWAEAGSAVNYRTHHVLPDYRGGLSYSRRYGRSVFLQTNADAVFVSRFGNDALVYSQNRPGLRISAWLEAFWDVNVTLDAKREYWANFVETGPGLGFKFPNAARFTITALRGAYTINRGNPRGPNFFDLRAGFWYAFSH